jgi:hypothetical protein
VLNLASGKYIIPSDKKNAVDAQAACASRGMSLASLETIAETDIVKDYLGSIGKK